MKQIVLDHKAASLVIGHLEYTKRRLERVSDKDYDMALDDAFHHIDDALTILITNLKDGSGI